MVFFDATPSVVIGQLLRSAFWNRVDSVPVFVFLFFFVCRIHDMRRYHENLI